MKTKDLTICISLAFVLWFFSFAVDWGNFWIKISASAMCLTALSAFFGFGPGQWLRFKPWDVVWGAGSAAALYAIFFLGDLVSKWLFPFATTQVGSIYAKGDGTPAWLICLLLFFITGPCEEIFWRGFVQERLAQRIGGLKGWLAATFFYTAIHLCAMNFMLIGAAAVAGLFWGFMYWRIGRIGPLIISHCIWTTTIFAIFPIRA